MSKQKTQQISFDAIKVSQGTFDFYLSVLSANIILPLCSTLRDTGIELFSSDSELWQENDGLNFIKAVESSEFAKTEFIKEVEQIQQESYDKDRPFQRIVDMARVQNIAAYLREEDALMPNPVILATRDTVIVEVQSDERPLKITLKWYGDTPTNIIDGQHRVHALRKLISERV
jgi:DGQHR domain-containing protein